LSKNPIQSINLTPLLNCPDLETLSLPREARLFIEKDVPRDNWPQAFNKLASFIEVK